MESENAASILLLGLLSNLIQTEANLKTRFSVDKKSIWKQSYSKTMM